MTYEQIRTPFCVEKEEGVCVSLCMCVGVHVCRCACVSVCVSVGVHVCRYVSVSVCMCVGMCQCWYACSCMYVCLVLSFASYFRASRVRAKEMSKK